MKTKILLIAIPLGFMLQSLNAQDCSITLEQDTISCSYSYTLKAYPFGGYWDLDCANTAGKVSFFSINDSLTSATVSQCGVYAFVYTYLETDSVLIDSSYVLDTLCIAKDTMQINFQNPSSADFELYVTRTIEFPEADCLTADTINCGNSLYKTVPPDPLWSFYTVGLCNSTIVNVGTPDSSCVVNQVSFSSTTTSNTFTDTFSIYQSEFLQQSLVTGEIISNTYGAVIDSMNQRIIAATEEFCPVPEFCPVSLPSCIDTVQDTTITILPIRLSGQWLFYPNPDVESIALADTTNFIKDDSIYFVVALPNAMRYDANFLFFQIDYLGDTIPAADLGTIDFQWEETWGQDTTINYSTRLVDTCCAGGPRIRRENLNEPGIPVYDCPAYPITFLDELQVFQSFEECTPDYYRIRVLISGGRGPYTAQGLAGELQDSIFISDTIAITDGYNLIIEDIDGCERQIVGNACPCVKVEVEVPDTNSLFCGQPCTELVGSASIAVGDSLILSWGDLSTQDLVYDSVLTVCEPGFYQFTAEDPVTGCKASTVTLVDSSDIRADAGPEQLLNCNLETVVLGGPQLSEGFGLIYYWEGPGIDSTTQSLPRPTIAEGGTYTLFLTVENTNCEEISSVVISENFSTPIADAGEDQVLGCQENPIVSIGGSGSSRGDSIRYFWEGTGIFPNLVENIFAQTTQAGIMTLTVSNINSGCTAIDTLAVTTLNPITFETEIVQHSCFNNPSGEILISNIQGGEAPYFYSTTGNFFNSINPLRRVPSGVWNVTVRDLQGCITSVPVEILLTPAFNISIPEELRYCETSDIVLDIGVETPYAPMSYEWSTGANGPVQAIEEEGEYWVIASNRCQEETLEFFVIDEARFGDQIEDVVGMPNAFTPDGDGANDVFKPIFQTEIEDYELQIFNRWGNKIFQTNDPEEGWDGRTNGTPSTADVFIWRLSGNVPICKGTVKPIALSGDLYLVR